MKKVILIFCVLSLLIFIRPALGLGTNLNSKNGTPVVTTQVDHVGQDGVFQGALKGIKTFYS